MKTLQTRRPGQGAASRHGGAGGAPLVVLLALLVGLGAAGCASTGEGRSASNRDLITGEELNEITAPIGNLYAAVELLRPMWLQARGGSGGEIAVAQGSTYMGPVESLRQIPITGVRSVTYLDASRATSYVRGLGSRHVQGAIVIEFGPR